MTDPGPARLLREMVQIPSVSGQETALADYLCESLAELGYLARVDGAGNVIGEAGDPSGPTILLLGHMDTVPGEIAVRQQGDLLFGRGTVDAKGALAAMAYAGARAAASLPARVVVAGAVGEETASAGARHLLGSPPPDALVIGEPSGAGQVVIGYKGMLRLGCRVSRPPHHTSGPGENAVEVAAAFWHAVRGRLPAKDGSGQLFGEAVPSLVQLEGDIEAAGAQISIRTPLGFDAAEFTRWAASRLPGDRLSVLESVPAVRTSRADPVVRALREAIGCRGGAAAVKVKLGTSDMNIVLPGWQIPAAAYGPGDSRLSHSADEHIDLRELGMAVDVLEAALPLIAASAASRRAQREAESG